MSLKGLWGAPGTCQTWQLSNRAFVLSYAENFILVLSLDIIYQ